MSWSLTKLLGEHLLARSLWTDLLTEAERCQKKLARDDVLIIRARRNNCKCK